MSDTSDANEAPDDGDDNNVGTDAEAPDPDGAVTGEGENAGDEGWKPLASTSLSAEWSNAGLEDVGPSDLKIRPDWGNAGLEPYDPNFQPLTTDWGNIGLAKSGPMGQAVMAPSPQAGVAFQTDQGLQVFFTVTLDVVDLGQWTKVSGLGMAISTADRGETAMNFIQHHLPAHLTYDKITLERPVTSNSLNVMNWISAYHMLPVPTAAQISCIDQAGRVIMTWDMLGVTPVAWKGPNFDAASTSPAMEQLTIQHMGFM